MHNRTTVQERLKELRVNGNYTQEEIGKILGMTAAGYGRLESENRSALKPEHCILLADFYNVTCDYIIRGINTENVDICKRTGLTQASVEKLEHFKSARDSILRELRNLNPNSDDRYKIELREELCYYNILHSIINSLMRHPVLESICATSKNALFNFSRKVEENSRIMYSEVFEFLEELGIDYYSEESTYAGQYVAGVAFGKFYESFIKSATLALDGYKDLIDSSDLTEFVEEGVDFEIFTPSKER